MAAAPTCRGRRTSRWRGPRPRPSSGFSSRFPARGGVTSVRRARFRHAHTTPFRRGSSAHLVRACTSCGDQVGRTAGRSRSRYERRRWRPTYVGSSSKRTTTWRTSTSRGDGERVGSQLVLVCAHGSRDACCARARHGGLRSARRACPATESSGSRPIRAAIASRRTCSSSRREYSSGRVDPENAVALTASALGGADRARPLPGPYVLRRAGAGGGASRFDGRSGSCGLQTFASCPSTARAYGSATGVEKSTRRPSRRPPARSSRPAAVLSRRHSACSPRSSFDARDC